MAEASPLDQPTPGPVLAQLWRGDLPLARAFWEFAVGYGLLANIAATATALTIISAKGPAVLALAVFLAPLPYTVLVVVGVWRSARGYGGPHQRADLARAGILAWALALTML